MLDEWTNSNEPGVWPNLHKDDLIAGVKSRLDNPIRINQASLPTCGPAVILFWMVVRRPYDYITFVRSMWESGQYTDDISGYVVKSTRKHRNLPRPDDITGVDWITLVSLRTTENLFLDINDFGLAWGITTPHEMMIWTKSLLGYAHSRDNGLITGVRSDVLRISEFAVNNEDAHGTSALLVDYTIFENNDPLVRFPNHWIAYISNYSEDENFVHFRAFTWGQTCDLSVPKSEWNKKGFDCIVGFSPDVTLPH